MNFTKKKSKQLGIKEDQTLHDYSFWMRVFRCNEVGSYLAGVIIKHKLGISPNIVTLTGTLLNLVSAVVLILPVPFYYKPICFFLLWFAIVTDYIDGILARETNAGTKFGHWFDNVQVHYLHLLVPVSVILSIYVENKNIYFLHYLVGVLFVSQLYRWSDYEMNRILLEYKIKKRSNHCSFSLTENDNSELHNKRYYKFYKVFANISASIVSTNWKVVLYMFCFVVPYATYFWAILIPLAELMNFTRYIISLYIKYANISDRI